ncbi:hypothetical protein [Aquipuribacter nitratireducens]|uniref:ArsA HSP20-like domain-containing protein n=1 Tax=Aquipuribacter nitratireducens TaxID=650104 RepID=A0ABW0GVS1_9MICO
MRLLVDPGCCPAGRGAAEAVRRAGGKAVVRPAARSDPDAGTAPATAWAPRLAAAWGIAADVVGLVGRDGRGLPVALVDELALWEDAAAEVAAGRADAVVVSVPRSLEPARFVAAPLLAARLLDERLAGLAARVGDDPVAASLVADLLDLRVVVRGLLEVAGTAVVVGGLGEHDAARCGWPVVGLPRVPARAPLAAPTATAGHRREEVADGTRYVWWCDLPRGARPALEVEGDVLHVRPLGEDAGATSSVRLPAALARCTTERARQVGSGDGTRLELRLRPDPGLWR